MSSARDESVCSPELTRSQDCLGLPSCSSSLPPPALEKDEHMQGHIGEQNEPSPSIPPSTNTFKLLTHSSS